MLPLADLLMDGLFLRLSLGFFVISTLKDRGGFMVCRVNQIVYRLFWIKYIMDIKIVWQQNKEVKILINRF